MRPLIFTVRVFKSTPLLSSVILNSTSESSGAPETPFEGVGKETFGAWVSTIGGGGGGGGIAPIVNVAEPRPVNNSLAKPSPDRTDSPV